MLLYGLGIVHEALAQSSRPVQGSSSLLGMELGMLQSSNCYRMPILAQVYFNARYIILCHPFGFGKHECVHEAFIRLHGQP